MSKDDNPFGSEPPQNPFGQVPPTDPFGRPVASDAAFGAPSEPASQPNTGDAWQTGPAPPPGGQYSAPPPSGRKAEGAVAALVLGIIGIVICPLAAPVAWGLGRKAERLVDASGRTLGGRGEATAGKVLGIIGTVLMILGIILFIALIAFGTSVDSGGGTTTTFNF